MAKVAIPGQVIGSLESHLPGAGTHVYENKIHASRAGPVVTSVAKSKGIHPTLSVGQVTTAVAVGAAANTSSHLPSVGSTILTRVLRVQQRQAILSVLAVLAVNPSSPPSVTPYTPIPALVSDDVLPQAILRREDVRAHEKDKIVMNDCFRVGDIVRASVISLGDERSYYVTTAGNEFGVVSATSASGNVMVPVSWKEMRDVVTGKGEGRKCAKP